MFSLYVYPKELGGGVPGRCPGTLVGAFPDLKTARAGILDCSLADGGGMEALKRLDARGYVMTDRGIVVDFFYADCGWSSQRESPLSTDRNRAIHEDRGFRFTETDPIDPATIGTVRSAADYID